MLDVSVEVYSISYNSPSSFIQQQPVFSISILCSAFNVSTQDSHSLIRYEKIWVNSYRIAFTVTLYWHEQNDIISDLFLPTWS